MVKSIRLNADFVRRIASLGIARLGSYRGSDRNIYWEDSAE
jgi:hypothetical protein